MGGKLTNVWVITIIYYYHADESRLNDSTITCVIAIILQYYNRSEKQRESQVNVNQNQNLAGAAEQNGHWTGQYCRLRAGRVGVSMMSSIANIILFK